MFYTISIQLQNHFKVTSNKLQYIACPNIITHHNLCKAQIIQTQKENTYLIAQHTLQVTTPKLTVNIQNTKHTIKITERKIIFKDKLFREEIIATTTNNTQLDKTTEN